MTLLPVLFLDVDGTLIPYGPGAALALSGSESPGAVGLDHHN
jgi:hypothetical protein